MKTDKWIHDVVRIMTKSASMHGKLIRAWANRTGREEDPDPEYWNGIDIGFMLAQEVLEECDDY